MWSIRILSGKLAGQFFQLKSGSTTIGRAPNCDVVIASQSVSKEHARIEVLSDKVILTDLGSRNGTFVNGVQIRSQKVQSGDKIALNDIIVELTDKTIQLPRKPKARPAQANQYQAQFNTNQYPPSPSVRQNSVSMNGYDGANAIQNSMAGGMMPQIAIAPEPPPSQGLGHLYKII